MENQLGPYRLWVLGVVALLITCEVLWNLIKNRKAYNLHESFANTIIFIGYVTSKILTVSYQLWVLGLFSDFAVFHLPQTPWVFVLSFFVTDFLFYWYHRVSHVVKFFWAFHLVHHSSTWMNLTASYRLNWFSAFISPYFFIPAVLLGFAPTFIALALSLNLFYQFFLHTEAIGKILFVEGIFNTPSAHRVHHGSNTIYIDKNLGGVLLVWDRIFGTYQPETEAVKYGITTGFVSNNPFKLIFHGFVDLAKGKLNSKG